MSSCYRCGIPVDDAKLTCDGCQAPTSKGRRRTFLTGATLGLAPVLSYVLWVVIFGQNFIEKNAPRFGIDERLIYMWYCFAGIITEVIALRYLMRVSRPRFDFIYVGAAVFAGSTLLLAFLFFVIIVGVAMGGS